MLEDVQTEISYEILTYTYFLIEKPNMFWLVNVG